MTEPRATELVQDRAELKREAAAIGDRLAAQYVVEEELVEALRALDRLDDDRVAHGLVDAKPAELRHRARRGDRGLLQRLEAEELAVRRVGAAQRAVAG